MVHPLYRGLSKKNVIGSSSRTSRFPKRSRQTTLPKSRFSTPGLEDHPLLLENHDNTICYLNSALNLLYMVKPIRQFLTENPHLENPILAEIQKIFSKTSKNARKLATELDMGNGAQSCHEVLKKVVTHLPLALQSTVTLHHQKISCCRECGESATPKKPKTTVEILLPEEGCLTLPELLTQKIHGTCKKCNRPMEIFEEYTVEEGVKSVFVSVLQADPMPIRDLETDAIFNLFGARWVLKGAVVYLPDKNPKIDYGENGHSISWTHHSGKWCKVSDEEMEVYEKFDSSDVDIEMMVFERIGKRN